MTIITMIMNYYNDDYDDYNDDKYNDYCGHYKKNPVDKLFIISFCFYAQVMLSLICEHFLEAEYM